MITDSYDDKSKAIITPDVFLGDKADICNIAIATFSIEIYSAVLNLYPNETVGMLKAANMRKPIHLLDIDGLEVAFYLSSIGSTLSGNDVIGVHWKTGADKIIVFGSAGSLEQKKTEGKYIIPTEAYRDEGLSYHYAPPEDYIKIKNADTIERMFVRLGLPYVKGRVWTTDAMYRETRNNVKRRKSEGCIAVEMELAGMQAVCNYYGIELYDFLVTGDVVDQPVYTPEGLPRANHDLNNFDIAVKVAKLLSVQQMYERI